MTIDQEGPTRVIVGPHHLEGLLDLPANARGLVIFAHGSGSGRYSPRNNHVARQLGRAGFATLLLDLLSPDEEADRRNVFDIDLLASRMTEATSWARGTPELADLPIGYFGASTGGGALLQPRRQTRRMFPQSFLAAVGPTLQVTSFPL